MVTQVDRFQCLEVRVLVDNFDHGLCGLEVDLVLG